MKLIAFSLVLFLVVRASEGVDTPTCTSEPTLCLNATELIKYNGYRAEEHTVTTLDRYLLTVQRIPCAYQQEECDTRGKPVILLQHGLLGCATNYLTNYRNQSLGYILADNNYDVWLGNVRGNTYSRGHLDYDPDAKHGKYWQFSWDEMAKYDIPAMVDYIRMVTGQDQIYYVGHSQGTLMAFAALSQNQELSKKIKVFFALAPVANISSAHSMFDPLAPYSSELEAFFSLVGYNEFLPSDFFLHKMAQKRCGKNSTLDAVLCKGAFAVMFNILDGTNLNHSRVPVYGAHNPAGTSSHNIAHYGQMMNSKKMQAYDYGELGNRFHYGQKEAPEYHPENMKTPTVFFTGGKDLLADPTDVDWLKKKLADGVLLADHYNEDYEHCDFIWAPSAPERVYKYILETVAQREK